MRSTGARLQGDIDGAAKRVKRTLARRILKSVVVVSVITLLTVAALEIGIRVIGEYDASGQFVFLGHPLPPRELPLDYINSALKEYLDHKSEVTLMPDAATGWTYRPNSKRQDGEFTINGAGLRALREHDTQPAADTLRIALFGDSFVAGDEVTDEEVWGAQLERFLVEAGVKAETLNFGVGGYSMGQAYLRWQSVGKDYSPDIVVFVFQAENLDRNVNIFHILYPQGRVIYSRPRFVLRDGMLSPVNSPALPPEALPGVFEAFDSHPLAAHEARYIDREFASWPLKASMLGRLAYHALNQLNPAESPAQIYGPNSERGQLGKAIVDAFAADVVDSGAQFIVLYLPHVDHFRAFHDGKRTPWQFLLDHFRVAYPFISAEEFLGVEYTDRAYYQAQYHYGPEINAKIAENVSAELLKCIKAETCKLTRFDDMSEIMR